MEAEKKQMTNMVAIRTYFEANGGRKVGMDELKALNTDERKELAVLAAKELDVELVPAK